MDTLRAQAFVPSFCPFIILSIRAFAFSDLKQNHGRQNYTDGTWEAPWSWPCARRKTAGQVVFARTELESSGPFICPDCNELVVLRRSLAKIPHFAHAPSGPCHFSAPESEAHLRCKIEIFQRLFNEPGKAKR
jgi:hypothetical protein